MSVDAIAQTPGKSPGRRSKKDAFQLTQQLIRSFLKKKETEGRSQQTLATYHRNLDCFYDFLAPEKTVTQDSLILWKEDMLRHGYAENTVNSRISSVNSFYHYLGRRNWQVVEGQRAALPEQPELTRAEYLALLRQAKAQENIQLYLLVKVLACTDLTPSDLPLLTREAVNEGCVSGKERGANGPVVLPEPLRSELLAHARQRGIKSGPLFINSHRNCHSRSVVMHMVRDLAAEIGMEPGKANPRNLRRLHLSTQAQFQKQADAWAAEQYAKLLQQEEATIAW